MKDDRREVTGVMYAKIGMLITSSLEIHEILEGIMTEIRQFFNPEHWSLLRLDHVTDELYFLFMAGEDLDKLKKFRLKSGEGIAGTVAQSRQSVFVPDVSKEPRFSDRVDRMINFKTRSIIAVPLIYRGTVHGVIEIVNSDKAAMFSEDDHAILKTIADFSAIAMANSSLYQKVIEQSSHDILTGLLNRRKLNEYITRWSVDGSFLRRERDREAALMVVYMDIDNFKLINDNYSHREGDLALITMSSMLKNAFRNDDMIFRVGGDEFLAIVQVRESDPERISRRISEALDKISYKSPDGKFSLTVSYGISSGPMEILESLINEADRKMYSKKREKPV